MTANVATVDGSDSTTITVSISNDKNSAGVTWTLSGPGALSNSTTTSVTYTAPAPTSSAQTATVTATSIADTTKSGTTTITIPAAPALTTGALASGTVGTAYSASLAASGGIPPYMWTLISGTMPAGLTLGSDGTISGKPLASGVGTANLKFQVTDAGKPTPLTAAATIPLTINAAPAITFTTTTLVNATWNASYSASIAATGGAGGLTYTLSAGALPAGLTLSTGGVISGTPTAVGTFSITVQAADAFGDSATQVLSLKVVYPALNVTVPTLPTGYQGSVYPSTTLAATGGSGTGYTWALANSTTLPAGLSLSTAGVISGTPTATGSTNFTVQVTDSASNTGTLPLTITVKAGVSITTTSPLPTAYVGSAYSQTLAALGGSGSGYSWAIASGSSAPAGLTLSAAGVLSGTPTTAGSPTFKVTVTDSASNTASATFALTISPGISITTSSLPGGYQTAVYGPVTMAASGGSGSPYSWTWAAASGSSLPAGLALSTGGVITGTPTGSGTFNIVFTAKDGALNVGTATLALTIEAQLSITTGTTLPSATKNVAYSQTLQASGGSGSGYTWSTTGANTLATIGLSFDTATAKVSGTPTTTGTGSFTAIVTDTQSHTAQATFSVTVYNALTVVTTTLPSTNVGVPYSQTLAAGGGSGTGYTWAASASNLATYGLALSSAGVVSGTPTTSGTASFTATVTDSNSNTASQALSITVYGALSLPTPNPSSLPAGYTGVAYSGSVTATGGSGTYAFTVTGLPADNLSAATGSNTVTISGTPSSTPQTVTFGITVKDTATNATTSQQYSIGITTPTPVTLPTPTTLPSATVNTSYNTSIQASGGVPPYTWSVNGSSIPTNGSQVSISNGIYVTNNSSNTLSVGGTPTSAGTVTLTNVKVTDSVNSTQTSTYTIAVNAAGSTVGGQIFLNNPCGGGSGNQPPFTVTINTSPAQHVQTDSNGHYSFPAIPNGTYTITPTISGATSSVFYPASYTGVVVNNANVNGQNFNAAVGYTVSGTVSYSNGGTPQSGQTFLILNNNNCSGGPGTSLTSAQLTAGGTFSIRGVPPGSYTLQAGMDAIGNGASNANNPSGSVAVTVSAASVTGVTVTMTNPTFATPSGNPKIQGVQPNNGGVLMFYSPSKNVNSVEDANQYTVQWSTSPTLSGGSGSAFATVSGSHTFKAIGDKSSLWTLNNIVAGAGSFTSGTTYYFQARSVNTLAASQSPSGWSTYTGSGSAPAGVTVGTPTCTGTCTTVSGTVTIPAGITIASGAPLYVGFYQQSSSGNGPSAIYAEVINSPASGANNYSLTIPSGSNYFLFGILDQNKDGLIDVGDVSNTDQGGNSTGVTISGSTQTVNTTLPSVNATATVSTQYLQNTYPGGSSSSYSLNMNLREANKLPVAVTITSGPNILLPLDLSVCTDCGTPQFQYYTNIPGVTPSVGDQYNFTVTYSDGTQDTGSTVNAQVTAFGNTGAIVGPSDLATNLAPSANSSTSTTPTFTWKFPANPSDYVYSFFINPASCSGNCTIWQVPSNNSNVNGFTYAETGSGTTGTLVWGVDPISGDNSTPTGPLTLGTQYNWQLQVQDNNGNQAQTQVWYQP